MVFALTTDNLSGLSDQDILDLGPLTPIEVRANGKLYLRGSSCGPQPHFFSKIEMLGPYSPLSRDSGLGVFSDLVIFNENSLNIFDSFAHFHGNPRLHDFVGVFMERGTTLTFDGNLGRILGTGGATFFRPFSGRNVGLESDMVSYRFGESFNLQFGEIRIPECASFT